MNDEAEWTIVFYVDEGGSEPVRAFIESLDTKTQTRFAWSLEQLRVRNIHAREPLARHIEDRLWELREESSGNIYRVFYIFYTGRRIVFLHGFQKKSRKTPRREIAIATARMQRFLARTGEVY